MTGPSGAPTSDPLGYSRPHFLTKTEGAHSEAQGWMDFFQPKFLVTSLEG